MIKYTEEILTEVSDSQARLRLAEVTLTLSQDRQNTSYGTSKISSVARRCRQKSGSRCLSRAKDIGRSAAGDRLAGVARAGAGAGGEESSPSDHLRFTLKSWTLSVPASLI